jgi:mannose-6-phosphate isomerase-like protein (cupin superfamily)
VWCELEFFEILHLDPGEEHLLGWRGAKERFFLLQGSGEIVCGNHRRELSEDQHLEVATPGGALSVSADDQAAIVVRIAGRWGGLTGGCGVFTIEPGGQGKNTGDAVDYHRSTDFDVHYHDCDEYWIIVSGQADVMSEGKHYRIGTGECLATGRGHHHDFVHIEETVRGVYFETTLEGEKRRGHLWNHTHGPAQPDWERV